MSAPNSINCFMNHTLPLELKIRVEEDEEDSSATFDATTVHEEIDIKQEQVYEDEEVIQYPLAVSIKEEWREEEDEEQDMTEPSYGESDAPEEEILPHAAMIVVPGGPVEYSEDFVEESIAVRPSITTVKHQKLSSKIVNTVYGCKDCSKCFSSEGYLRQHIRRACPSRVDCSEVDTVYRCPNCSLCYTSREYLARHVRRGCRFRPTPIKNAYLCVICGEGFNNCGDLYHHKRQKHRQTPAGEPVSAATRKKPSAIEAPRTFQCANCPRAFSADMYLEQHQKSHLRRQTDHCCDLCGEDFQQMSLSMVEEHFAKRHPTKEALRCNQCEKVYGYRHSLVIHLQTHNGVFQCVACKKQFASRKLLSAHFLTHAPNQPFKCNICRKSYLRLDRFYEHRRQEHKEKPVADPGERWQDLEYADDVDDDVQVISVVDASVNSRTSSKES